MLQLLLLKNRNENVPPTMETKVRKVRSPDTETSEPGRACQKLFHVVEGTLKMELKYLLTLLMLTGTRWLRTPLRNMGGEFG